jgi:hypothetical protein
MLDTAARGREPGDLAHYDEEEDVATLMRTSLAAVVTPPSRECRQRAWKSFEQALQRHLERKGEALRPLETRR